MKYVLSFAICTAMFFTGCGKSKPMKIVCFGDSLTSCGGQGGRYSDYLQAWLSDCEVINKGIGGDTLGGGRKRYQRDVLDLKPDVVIIELGANDYWGAGRPISELSADLESMVRDAKNCGAQVVIASCFGGQKDAETPPKDDTDKKRKLYAKGIADFEADIVKRYECYYVPDMQVDIAPNGRVPYWSDNNHPNKAGNEFVAKRIYAELKKALAKVGKRHVGSAIADQ